MRHSARRRRWSWARATATARPFRFGAVDLYEVGLFTRELSPAERDQLEAYVQLRHELIVGAAVSRQRSRLVPRRRCQRFRSETAAWSISGAIWRSHGRHWLQSTAGRPLKTTDGNGRSVVQFDGIDDLLALTGPIPTLEPFSAAVVYRVRERGDFAGILTAAPPAGTDHTDFWTFRDGTAGSLEMQLFGRSAATDPLTLNRIDSAATQVAVWTVAGGAGELRDGAGSSADSYGGSFGAPLEIVLGGRYAGAPFGYAAIDVLATIGAMRALSTTDQARLVAWANAKWSL